MKKLLPVVLPLFLFSCLDSNDLPEFDNSADIAYLEENAQREGVTVTSSGLQYFVMHEGEGEQPGPNDHIIVHYRGELISGDVFDSSFAREEPAAFSLSGVISGFSEGIQLMSVGSVYELVLPSELAYGNNPPFGSMIYPGATLIFEVQLIVINTADIEYLQENSEQEGVTVTSSGLQYRILQEGEGNQPGPGDNVVAHYRGELVSGVIFENTFENEEPETFSLADVISGFSEGIQLMSTGSVYELVLPAQIAYGFNPPEGSIIYPGATLIYEVELIEIAE